MKNVARAGLIMMVVGVVAGCADPVEVWPPSWHPANAGGAGDRPMWEGRALAESEPVGPAEAGVVPPNAGGMDGHDGHDMHGHGDGGDAGGTGPAVYVCPMHPEVTSEKPGECPKCGMDLVKKGRGGGE